MIFGSQVDSALAPKHMAPSAAELVLILFRAFTASIEYATLILFGP